MPDPQLLVVLLVQIEEAVLEPLVPLRHVLRTGAEGPKGVAALLEDLGRMKAAPEAEQYALLQLHGRGRRNGRQEELVQVLGHFQWLCETALETPYDISCKVSD